MTAESVPPQYWFALCQGARASNLVLDAVSEDELAEAFASHPLLGLPELPSAMLAAAVTDGAEVAGKYVRAASVLQRWLAELRGRQPLNYGAILGNCALALIHEQKLDSVINVERAVRLAQESRRYFPEGSPQFAFSILHEGIANSTLAELGREPAVSLATADRLFRQAASRFPAASFWRGASLMNRAQVVAIRVRLGLAPEASLGEAIPLYQAARALFSRQDRDLPHCLGAEAEVRFRLAKSGAEPIPNLQTAAGLFRAARTLLPPHAEPAVRWLADLGAALALLAEYGVSPRESLREALQCVQEAQRFLRDDSENLATCMANESSIRLLLVESGDDVDTNLQKILSLGEQVSSLCFDDPLPAIDSLLSLAAAHTLLADRMEDPQEHFQRSLGACARASRLAGQRADLTARCEIAEGITRSAMGEAGFNSKNELTHSVGLFCQARAALLPESSHYLAALLNEGYAHERLALLGIDPIDHLDTAIELYRQARRLSPPESQGLARSLTGEGRTRVIQAEMGFRPQENLLQAMELLRVAYQACQDQGYTIDLVLSLLCAANAQMGLTKLEKDGPSNLKVALELYDRAVALCRGEGIAARYLGACLMNKGNAILALCESCGFSQAELMEAVALFQEAGSVSQPQSVSALRCLLNEGIARQYLVEIEIEPIANFDRAVLLFSQAGEQLATLGHPREAMISFKNLGMLLLRRGMAHEALRALERAVGAAEEIRAATLLPRDRQHWLERQAVLFQAAVEACLACGLDARAVEYVEQGRARGLSDLLASAETGPRVPSELAERYRDLRRRAAALEAMQSESLRARRTGGEERQSNLAAEKRRIRDSLSALEEEIRRRDPDGLPSVLAAPFNEILDLPRLLARAVVVLFIGRDRSVAFLMSPLGELETIPLPELNQVVAQEMILGKPAERGLGGWTGTYVQYREKGVSPAQWRAMMDRILPCLYEVVMRAIHLRLRERGERRAMIILTGSLAVLPLHAASWSEDGETRYLADEIEISYAPSAWVLRRSIERQRRERSPFLGVATAGAGPELPFVRWEICRIAAMVGAQHGVEAAHTLVDKTATLARVADLLSKCSWLHFACHGESNPLDPWCSQLILADGELSLAQIYGSAQLDRARLAVLSACESGSSTTALTLGGEYLGLPAGLILAGANSVVGSLWSVQDAPTALLMVRMSRNLIAGQEVATALVEGQRWLRRLDRHQALAELTVDPPLDPEPLERFRTWLDRQEDHPFMHPHNWAAFIACGSPQPVMDPDPSFRSASA